MLFRSEKLGLKFAVGGAKGKVAAPNDPNTDDKDDAGDADEDGADNDNDAADAA